MGPVYAEFSLRIEQMPRKAKAPASYHKAKNGRYYKKVVVDGKTRCRFVSAAEAEGRTVKPKRTRRTKELNVVEVSPESKNLGATD